jgi:hypothetical protein
VQKLTQALKSIKGLGLGNTFDLNLKWARSLPSGILHGIFIEPLSRKFIFLSKSTFDTLLWA